MEIIELIPYGEENAVKRKWLVRRCIEKGLVDADSKDPDREMRKLIHKAREKYVILNRKGGVSTENHRIRTSAAYRNWRTEVLSRDKYICQRCGKEGGKLNVHHIKSFCANKELRTSIDNGITLCEECHREVHKHAR